MKERNKKAVYEDDKREGKGRREEKEKAQEYDKYRPKKTEEHRSKKTEEYRPKKVQEYRSKNMDQRRKLYGWGPLSALLIIKIVSLTTIYCNAQWWPPTYSLGGMVNASVFLLLATLTLVNFLSSVYEGPGFLPKEWKPEDCNTRYLQFCNVCKGYKAPRSHHCKKCDRCVMKMDHHCPWINTCVGFNNHASFILFLFSAVCACAQSTGILSCSLYRAIYKGWYLHYGRGTEPLVTLGLFGFIACVFALGLSIGVVLGVGFLLFFQLRAIVRNRTGIEDWILEKAIHRRLVAHAKGEPIEPFIFPYHLGVWENIRQVLNWEMKPLGDGITWPIVSHPKCDQYTLTREQMEQKAEKKQRAKAYTAEKEYSGRWLPLAHGWRVFCSPPYTDENRLRLSVGDRISVTRWRRHWLFGERIGDRTGGAPAKGWFPRCCVIRVDEDNEEEEEEKKEQ